MLDKELKDEVTRLADLIDGTSSVMVHQVGQYCYVKREGGGPHVRFRSEFPGETIKADDLAILGALFTELARRDAAKLASAETEVKGARGRQSAQNQA